jgi:hypothetical protein
MYVLQIMKGIFRGMEAKNINVKDGLKQDIVLTK